MTVIRPNSVSGITSITAQANEINFFRSNGTLAGLQLNGVNFNTTTGVSTFNNLDVRGVLTYQDVTNVDSVGIITARSTIDAQGAISLADSIIHTGDTNTKIRFPSADTISFETSGGERLKITSTGLIYVNGDGTGGRIDATAGDGSMTFSDGNGRQTLKIKTMGSGQSAAHVFDASGRLGIGTDNPTNNLQVNAASNESTISLFNAGTKKSAFQASNSFGTIIYSYDSEPLVFSVASGTSFSEKARILSDGKIGIGITNPAALTHIYDSANRTASTEQFRISGGNRSADTFETGFRFFTQSPSANGNRYVSFTSNGNTGLSIQTHETSTGNAAVDRHIALCPSGGSVNIGGNPTQSTAPLSVTTDANDYGIRLLTGSNVVLDMLNNDGSGNCEIRGYYNNNSGTRGEGFRIESNGNTFFSPAGSNRNFTISNAEFQVNNNELQVTSSNSYACHFNYQDNGSNYISFAQSGSTVFRNNVGSGQVMIVYGSGNIGAPSGNNIYNASDERLKENMVELTDGLEKIKKLKPYSFTWKKGFDKDLEGVTQYGFGAHQAKSVDEKLVEKFSENDIELDGETIKDPLRVNEKHVIPLLVKAIQELSAKVAALEGS